MDRSWWRARPAVRRRSSGFARWPGACFWSNDGYIYRFHREGNVIAWTYGATPGAALQPVHSGGHCRRRNIALFAGDPPDGKGADVFQVGYRDGRWPSLPRSGPVGHRVLVEVHGRDTPAAETCIQTTMASCGRCRSTRAPRGEGGKQQLVSEGVPTTIVVGRPTSPCPQPVRSSTPPRMQAYCASSSGCQRNGQRVHSTRHGRLRFKPRDFTRRNANAGTVRDEASRWCVIKRVAGGAPVKCAGEQE